ncbi:uncharacterized protein LOC126840922 isoform X2 [Adelges cooleyi]|uniref:uncharacterized protein LOC126840922 isoform X2 n=1 Tax=Adelges cooleyi TaxID=133065 RepID=UPI00217F7029|nr:uncharacterized protein LOC126840922 isoform X2 [Adelges cooleyi]
MYTINNFTKTISFFTGNNEGLIGNNESLIALMQRSKGWKLSNKMPTTHPKYSHYEGKADQYGVYSREHSDAIYDIVTADFFNELDKLEKIENAYYTDDSLSD